MSNDTTSSKVPWPKPGEKHKNAIDAFTKTLTRGSYDWEFRQRLLKPDTAKIAVAEEGNIDIPETEVIVFYENEGDQSSADKRGPLMWAWAYPDMRNEHYHFFCLPPFDKNSKEEQAYQKWQTGAYRVWWELK
jgi:hypothetical protein